MNKFIACNNGDYVNIDYISKIYVDKDSDVIVLVEGLTRILSTSFTSDEAAQEWLDKFMEKHGLCIEPTTASRCY